MKRLIACAALMVVAAGAFVALVARADEEPGTRDRGFPDAPVARTERVPVSQEAAGEESAGARQQLIERFKAKVQLMNPEEVRQELELTDADIRVRTARIQLARTVATLHQIVNQYEGTPSAEIASAMIQLHETHRRPTPVGGDAPFYGAPVSSPQPIPDDQSSEDFQAPQDENGQPGV